MIFSLAAGMEDNVRSRHEAGALPGNNEKDLEVVEVAASTEAEFVEAARDADAIIGRWPPYSMERGPGA